MVRARCVFPVPGRPVSSRELPARQWLIGSSTPFHLRCLGALRLHARRPAAQQRLRLFHAVDRRAVRVAQRLQRPQPLREALRQPLRQQAVRLHLRQVARRRVQDAPGLGHHAVLKAQHRVVDGAVGAVAQQPPRVLRAHRPIIAFTLSLAVCSSPCHAASMRSSARRSVAASTWLRAEMPNTM